MTGGVLADFGGPILAGGIGEAVDLGDGGRPGMGAWLWAGVSTGLLWLFGASSAYVIQTTTN